MRCEALVGKTEQHFGVSESKTNRVVRFPRLGNFFVHASAEFRDAGAKDKVQLTNEICGVQVRNSGVLPQQRARKGSSGSWHVHRPEDSKCDTMY